MLKNTFDLTLPPWLSQETGKLADLESVEQRVTAVLQIARRNVVEQTGGPFAAMVYDRSAGRIVSVGVNLVVRSNLSIAHAEVVAISLAQRELGTYDLSGFYLELISSCEPCQMCAGAFLWSGIRSLVYCSDGEDARRIGFDEGDKLPDWDEGLRRRGLKVEGPVLRDQGREVFNEYVKSGGTIYNSNPE